MFNYTITEVGGYVEDGREIFDEYEDAETYGMFLRKSSQISFKILKNNVGKLHFRFNF